MPISSPNRLVNLVSATSSTGSSGRQPYRAIQRTGPTMVVARTYWNSSLGIW